MSFLKRLFGGRSDPVDSGASDDDARPEIDRGIFAGLFVATPAAVERWDLAGLTPSDWPAMEFKRLDTVKLGTLEAILTGVHYDDLDQDELHNLVRAGGEEGPWVSLVREPLVTALVSLEDERIRSTAEAWGATEEFTIGRRGGLQRDEIEALADAIGEMTALARVARERGEPMYLLMAL